MPWRVHDGDGAPIKISSYFLPLDFCKIPACGSKKSDLKSLKGPGFPGSEFSHMIPKNAYAVRVTPAALLDSA